MPTQAKEIFEAQSKSVRELLSDNGLGLYLPPYQRPYGWGKDKVEKLLDDTLHGLKNLGKAPDSFTFLGTVITIHDVNHVTVKPIVKSEVPSKVLTVIDGQQRLSSLLILLVGLHNLIRQRAWKVFKGKALDPTDSARTHLYSETSDILQMLGAAFYERKNFGTTPIYPRLIRAFVDQWARDEKLKQYESPIANLIYQYSLLVDNESADSKPTDFKPAARQNAGEGEGDLIKRFNEIRIGLTKLSQRKTIEELEDLPPLATLATNIEFQRALFNHELDSELCAWIGGLEDEPEAELMRLVMFAAYGLNRIALTVVQGKDEDYAFTIFESLNTTGEPLTAFETFLPRVVMAEKIQDYQESDAHAYMKEVQGYLDRFDVGDKLQNATRDLLVTFALAETGEKLSKRLPDQRVYMRDTFEGHKDSADERSAYLRHLRDTAAFVGNAWESTNNSPRALPGLEATAMTDAVKLCLGFLDKLNHTIAIAPLVRFYSEAVHADEGEARGKRIAEFEKAIKAITAFTVFWRSTRRGTGNIDSQYRAVMAGPSLTGMVPLARQSAVPTVLSSDPAVDAEALKKELVARLLHPKHGAIPNLPSFLADASALPLYKMARPLTRFLLLAAYHDTIEDPGNPGLIIQGKAGVASCFTADGWADETHLTVEHIAPQQATSGWDEDFYSDKETVHKLGNLVLAPNAANASLSSRPWNEKKVLYAALGAPTADDAKSILTSSGLTFAQSTEDLTALSRYLPHLRALGQREDELNPAFMDQRAVVLLRLAYTRLKGWLGLELSDSSSDLVVKVDDVEIENDEFDGSEDATGAV
ncbi:DUF262 domain-containing protein [Streptomyces acidiscabies]|uniref:DUF262 domain-containing HNH endonuclease family protein n=1 Tax=Streptomyces acidiscabies TaxID=42234 RepID=A0AAP6BKX3_9ACTN|nr:DUF262 domain-containing HNH endonuclease family protein [Streptomyces acidiscabies]MBP5937923.1 DUF262 domain-containing protein [Streptomyces sp. LBUM 1476]MBZ3908924.1 DUF262 domain-containing protein [Streptomyces acidiscabies]MDX2966570.1 DUF262 domain-containing HNH endonuclease family protein [Streptomyces acidiscabies]MDX3016669.1 DUF262 domain-containing HNH endonuclease family protein [Streptomyces acidiscabies]MDX3788423.1 DUF262 domain-containing HNH endonuclease family protein 